MTDTPQYQNVEYDEIDLIQLLANFLKLITKYIWIVVIFTIIGGVFGLFFMQNIVSYETQAIAQSRVLSISEVRGIVDNFNQLIKQNNYDLLNKRTNLKKEDLYTINSLSTQSAREFEQGYSKKVDKDSVFVIKVEVNSLDILPKLSESITNYINSNDFVKEKTKNYEDNHTQYLKQIRDDIKHANLMKKEVITAAERGESVDLGDIYEQTLLLMERELIVRDRLNQKGDIQFISDFITHEKSLVSSSTITTILGIALGFFLAIVLIFVIELIIILRKRMKDA